MLFLKLQTGVSGEGGPVAVSRFLGLKARYPLPRTAPSALALGLFLVWLDIAFRANAGVFQSSTVLQPLESDGSWLVVLAAASVASLALSAACRGLRIRWDALGPGALRGLLATGSVLASAGTYVCASTSSQEEIALLWSILAGMGLPLLVIVWFSVVASFDERGVVVILAEGTLVSIVVMSTLLVLDGSAAVMVMGALPLGSALCLGRSCSCRPNRDDGPSEDTDSLDKKGARQGLVVVLTSCLIVFFLLGATGAPASAPLRSVAFWLYDVAAVGEIAFLLAAIALGVRRLPVALVVLLASAIALIPFLYAAELHTASVVFLKLTTLCTYALVILELAGQKTPPPASVLLMLFAVAGLMDMGLVVGDVLRRIEALSAATFALIGIALLYLVAALAFVLLSRNRSVQVRHVITGSFNSESEMARAQVAVLAGAYPALSARELEVLELLLQHYSTAGIAQELVVSENTVKTHVRHIYGKMGVNSKQQLLSLSRQLAPHAGSSEDR